MTLKLSKCIADVADFHAKFGIDINPLDNEQQYELRVKRQGEELQELSDAVTLEQGSDALIDILYIAAGTLHLLGDRNGGRENHPFLNRQVLHGIVEVVQSQGFDLPLAELWDEVHAANMRKVRGTEGTSKYGNKFDIVKPEGWVGPDLGAILIAHGFDAETAKENHIRWL
jgi:predicted HAD superfamily Cof-like phosphohydrolase